MRGPLTLLVLFVLAAAAALYALNVGDEAPEPPPAPVAATPAPAPAVAPERPPPPTLPVDAPVDDAPGDDVRVLDLTGNASFFALFDELGIDDVEGKLAAWGMARGYPQLDDQGNPLLDQPYQQYDDDTLRAFAENDDMWAQQFLAERLAATRPAEALEWYRRAAINGSIHAMSEMSKLYKQLGQQRSGIQGDEAALNQLYALQDGPDSLAVTGYAWSAVAERAGWDPLRGSMTATFVGAKLSEDQIRAACDFASTLYSDLVAARGQRGLPEYDRKPPPVVFDPGTTGGTACHSDEASTFLADCREVQVTVDGQVSRLWTCE